MNLEIERKFLVKSDFKHLAIGKFEISQGYLSSVPERTVRVRIASKKGFITVKGKSDKTGMARFEWEKEIPFNEAKDLLKICENKIIDKTRYIIEHNEHIIEVDVFKGDNKGLVLAEIELENSDDKIVIPNWLGTEVTNNNKYYNSYLSEHPFTTW